MSKDQAYVGLSRASCLGCLWQDFRQHCQLLEEARLIRSLVFMAWVCLAIGIAGLASLFIEGCNCRFGSADGVLYCTVGVNVLLWH